MLSSQELKDQDQDQTMFLIQIEQKQKASSTSHTTILDKICQTLSSSFLSVGTRMKNKDKIWQNVYLCLHWEVACSKDPKSPKVNYVDISLISLHAYVSYV